MNIKEKKLENATVELQIEVPVDRVEIEYRAAFEKIQKSAKIDGFRKGKVPLQIVETRFSERADKEVAENLLKGVFFEAVQQKQLTPIAIPRYQFDSIIRGKPFSFTATFEIPPSVELGKYKGITADEQAITITDENVQNEIDTIREQHSETEPRGEGVSIRNGDHVRLKVRRIDDVPEAERSSVEFKEFSIVVGKSKDESALDKHITGMKVGEMRDVDVKYPKDYYIKTLAGQKVTYQVMINEISELKLPELNDEFAKKVGYESTDDFRQKTREYLEKYIQDRTRGDAKAHIINEIVDNSQFDLPETMVLNEMNEIFRKTQQRFGIATNSIDELASMLEMDAERLRTRLREDAERSVKTTLVLSEIAKKEEMKVDEERYRQVIETLAVQNNTSVEEIEKIIEKNQSRGSIETELLLNSSMDFLYDNAKIKSLKAITFDEFVRRENKKE